MPSDHRTKRRRLDVMRFIDIAAADADEDDDEAEEEEEIVCQEAEQNCVEHSAGNPKRGHEHESFNSSAFFQKEAAELDRDHLEEIAKVFKERARTGLDRYQSPDYDDDSDEDSHVFNAQWFGTKEVFTAERMAYIAGVRQCWMLPMKEFSHQRSMSSEDRGILRKRIKLLSNELRLQTRNSLADNNNGTRSSEFASVFTFDIPRRRDVIYIVAPNPETVHQAFTGIYSVDLPAAQFVPIDELPQLYEWSRMDTTVIPDLLNGQFVRIRKRGLFGQGELSHYDGDLAYVADIMPNLADRNRDVLLLSLIPRLHYKGDKSDDVRMFPISTELKDRAVQTYDLSAPQKSRTRKPKPLRTSVSGITFRDSGCLTDAAVCHDAAVQTVNGLELTQAAGVQAYDMSALDSLLSIIYERPLPVVDDRLSAPTYRDACTEPGSAASTRDVCVQASFSVPDPVPRPLHSKSRPPQRLFIPEIIEQQHPSEIQESSGRVIFRGQLYMDGLLLVTLSGYDSVIRAWPTPDEAWMFLEERLGSALIVNMAYLRVGDNVGLYEVRDLFMRANKPEMVGIVKDIGLRDVKVKVDGLSGLVHHRIDKLWRIIREGDWVEDMFKKKGQIGIVLHSYPDDSLDICYWDDAGNIQHYSSYAWYIRTADQPTTMAKPIPQLRALRKPLVPKLEPLGDQMRRFYRNSFVGKDAYVFEGHLKGRIGRVFGINDHQATLVFGGELIKYHIDLSAAVNINTMLRLDARAMSVNTLVDCQQAINYLWWEAPEDKRVPGNDVMEVTTIGYQPRPSLGMHWLINPLVTKHFRIHKVFARFLPGHQRAGQLAWTRADTCIHITCSESGLSYELELEHQSKNFGEVHQERTNPAQVTVANPIVDCNALVISGDHTGKLCTVKAINRDPKNKAVIGFKVKFDGAGRGQTSNIAYTAITRADRLSASALL